SRVTVVGLGPGDLDLVTAGATSAIAAIPHRFVRTRRHPAASLLAQDPSFDEIYEAAGQISDVYSEIVERLISAANTHGHVLYAVPGSPVVAERTVELLLDDDRVEVDLVASLSFVDLAWIHLRIDPMAAGVRLVDGHQFAVEAAGERGPLLVGQCDSRDVLSDIKLSVDRPPEAPVTVLQRLGLEDQSVFEVSWNDLDRMVQPDHLTSLYVPELVAPVAAELMAFDQLVYRLRQDCPWDAKQTHESLTRHLLEETYEVLEAIEGLDDEDANSIGHLEEELGDLLFQVFFHAVLASERGWFDLSDVARGIHTKLYTRHPHVFGDLEVFTAEEVKANWEQIKLAEKGRDSLMDGIPVALPGLLYAWKVQKKAAGVGFDWPDVKGPISKIHEELGEFLDAYGSGDQAAARRELGDLLFSVVNVARHLELDPESALHASSTVFKRRFQLVEKYAAADGASLRDADLTELDQYWDRAKIALAHESGGNSGRGS
ncbi:MAG: nucleoside triphosphate pyrophosphohydrolase, partial [Acidimicrobiales bacterium]